MKLIVTVGNDNGDNEELVFDVPEPITWIGVEIEIPAGRSTILRMPFHMHGERIHTLCRYNSDPIEVKW